MPILWFLLSSSKNSLKLSLLFRDAPQLLFSGTFSIFPALSLIISLVSCSKPQKNKIIYSFYTQPKKDMIIHIIMDITKWETFLLKSLIAKKVYIIKKGFNR